MSETREVECNLLLSVYFSVCTCILLLAIRIRAFGAILLARPAGGPSLRSGSSLRSPALRAGSLRSRARYARQPPHMGSLRSPFSRRGYFSKHKKLKSKSLEFARKMELKMCKLLGVFSQISHFWYVSPLKMLFLTTSSLLPVYFRSKIAISDHFRSTSGSFPV